MVDLTEAWHVRKLFEVEPGNGKKGYIALLDSGNIQISDGTGSVAMSLWAWFKTGMDRRSASEAATEIATLTERLRVAEEALERLDEHPDAIGSHPLNKPSTMLRRVRKARRFPDNTCPASRHVQIMAEYLVRGEPYDMIETEPVHVGGSMLSVITSLYEARTELVEARAALAAIKGE